MPCKGQLKFFEFSNFHICICSWHVQNRSYKHIKTHSVKYQNFSAFRNISSPLRLVFEQHVKGFKMNEFTIMR